jgi:peptidoglycan/xylan/chitin deacetylase (PgdA/CDA1 family)
VTRALAILAYHKIGEPSADAWDTWYYVPRATFAGQLRQLRELGWEVVDAETATSGLVSPDLLPPRSALITFDDGYRSVLDHAAPTMVELGCPGAMFVATDFIGDVSRFDEDTSEPPEPVCCWDELRELERTGISVQSHGASHRPFSGLSVEQIREELVRSKALLDENLGKSVDLFGFPQGDPGSDARAVSAALDEAGYRGACLFEGGPVRFPVPDSHLLPRIPMWRDTNLSDELR